jgi:hypothetical protein
MTVLDETTHLPNKLSEMVKNLPSEADSSPNHEILWCYINPSVHHRKSKI